MSNRSSHKQSKKKRKELKLHPGQVIDVDPPLTGRHYDYIVMDDMIIEEDHPLLGGAVANNADPKNWPQNQNLTLQTITDTIKKLEQAAGMTVIRGTYAQIIAPGLHALFNDFLRDVKFHSEWSKEEMAKQVEIYKNVIETKYGVKLCVKENLNSDMITMELLVPNKLFAAEDGRESLADALQNIAMFILNMEDPN